MLSLSIASPAAAGPEQPTVRTVTVQGDGPTFSSSLTLTFEQEVTQSEAQEIRGLLGAAPIDEGVAPSSSSPTYDDDLWCGGAAHTGDANGDWDVAYQCLSTTTKRTVPWGFKMSPQVQAIVRGNVNEGGMWWWKNHVSQNKNAAHNEPADYRFHGNFNPVKAREPDSLPGPHDLPRPGRRQAGERGAHRHLQRRPAQLDRREDLD